MNVNKKYRHAFARVESIVGKGESAGYQHFLLFPQCFQKAIYYGFLMWALQEKQFHKPYANPENIKYRRKCVECHLLWVPRRHSDR